MKYDDTHITEAQLRDVDGNAFEMAMLADESGKPPRYLYSSPTTGSWQARPAVWRRLVVHVSDMDAEGVSQRVLDALGVELMDVPF